MHFCAPFWWIFFISVQSIILMINVVDRMLVEAKTGFIISMSAVFSSSNKCKSGGGLQLEQFWRRYLCFQLRDGINTKTDASVVESQSFNHIPTTPCHGRFLGIISANMSKQPGSFLKDCFVVHRNLPVCCLAVASSHDDRHLTLSRCVAHRGFPQSC